jgi:hypothetical protein
MTRRQLRPALALLVAVLATACQVRTTVTVDVADDGSGTVDVAVGLDEEALGRVPDLDGDGVSDAEDLAALVRDDDLTAAGWTVAEPDAADGGEGDDDGLTWLRVSRAFGTPEEGDRILAGLTGPDGPLRDLQLTRGESFGRTEYTFTGTADLSGGLEAFGDEGLAAALEGEPLGEDAAAIEARFGEPLADMFTLEVTARLAGDETTWTPRLGEGPVALEAESTRYEWPVLALTLVSAAALLALLVVLAGRLLRSGRRD